MNNITKKIIYNYSIYIINNYQNTLPQMKTYEMFNTLSQSTNYYTNRLKQSQSSYHTYANNNSFNNLNQNNESFINNTPNLGNSENFISSKSLPLLEQNNQQETYTLTNENNNNKTDRIEDELQKANEMIALLREQNESLLSQRDSAVNQLKRIKDNENVNKEDQKELENYINVTKEKLERANKRILDLENENEILKGEIQRLNEELYNKEKVIEQCNLENSKLRNDLGREIMNLKNTLDKQRIIFENKKNELVNANKDLNEKIDSLSKSLLDEKLKNEKLELERQNDLKINQNTKKVLDALFSFYNNANMIFNPKAKKEILNEIIEIDGPDEIKEKLKKLEDKIKNLSENYKLKFGKCFACDIACCTSHLHRMKFFSGK